MNTQSPPQVAPSEVTCSLVTQLVQRDAFGQHKYGVSMDRKDLSIDEWLQHGVEKLLDAAGHLTAAKREIAQLQGQLLQTQQVAKEYALLRRDLDMLIRAGEHPNRYIEGQNYQAGYRTMFGRIKDLILRHDSGAVLRQLQKKKNG